jgi:hypothetical protein
MQRQQGLHDSLSAEPYTLRCESSTDHPRLAAAGYPPLPDAAALLRVQRCPASCPCCCCRCWWWWCCRCCTSAAAGTVGAGPGPTSKGKDHCTLRGTEALLRFLLLLATKCSSTTSAASLLPAPASVLPAFASAPSASASGNGCRSCGRGPADLPAVLLQARPRCRPRPGLEALVRTGVVSAPPSSSQLAPPTPASAPSIAAAAAAAWLACRVRVPLRTHALLAVSPRCSSSRGSAELVLIARPPCSWLPNLVEGPAAAALALATPPTAAAA